MRAFWYTGGMVLLPNEREVHLGLPGILLTSHRIRQGDLTDQVTSIMLENVTRIAAKKQEYPALLLLGVLLLLIGVVALLAGGSQGVGVLFLCGLLGVVFIAAYFGSRNTVLFIASADGGGIGIQAGHMPAERMREYISMIEEAIDAKRRFGQPQPTLPKSPALSAPPGGPRTALPTGKTYRIARNGTELGDQKIPAIKAMIARGELSLKDYYLDPVANDWMPLDCLSDLA